MDMREKMKVKKGKVWPCAYIASLNISTIKS